MAARDGVAARGAAAALTTPTTATARTDGEPESRAAEQAAARRAAGLRSYFGYPALDQMAAGLTAGALSTAVLQPLDVVKTRLQVQDGIHASKYNRPYYRGSLHAVRTMYQTEGFRSLYQGMSPSLAGATLSWGLYFFWYDIIKRAMAGPTGRPLTNAEYMVAAAAGGAATVFVTNPIFLVKTRMCIQDAKHPDAYKGLFDGLWRTYKGEGLRGLYKGLIPSLFGTLHGSLQFVAYERMKQFFAPPDGKPTVAQNLFMSTTSKVFATCGTYPYQVVRSRLMDQRSTGSSMVAALYTGPVDAVRKIWRHEGVYGFYRGLIPGTIRVLPATWITFVVYEEMSHLFKRYAT